MSLPNRIPLKTIAPNHLLDTNLEQWKEEMEEVKVVDNVNSRINTYLLVLKRIKACNNVN